MLVLVQFFTCEEDFLKFIVVKLREHYEGWLKKKLRGYINYILSTGGTPLSAVKEVSLLCYISPYFQSTHLLTQI